MRTTLLLTAAVASALAAPVGLADPTSREVQRVVERDFKARGQATMDRAVQDGVQRVCTESNNVPGEAVAKAIEADQLKSIPFPAGSLVGDWKRGEAIAQSGRGMTWVDKAGTANGGSCYNCHQLSPKEASYGTLGPSLLAFGKKRGNTPEMQRYAYGKIYNAKAYNACSQMPRMGTSGTLTEAQIKDLVGLLMDPASPVNQ
jgi:sulfur-oxidizing protein SoxX